MIDVSICMPYYERLDKLRRTVLGFIDLGYFDGDLNVELSICDDGSKNEPLTVKHLEDWGIPFVLSHLPVKEDWMNPCTPFNKAVNQSTGKYILLQDPETIHRVPILKPMIDMMPLYIHTVLCPTKKDWKDGELKWRLHPVHQPMKFRFCQMVTRAMWEKTGGFDERFRDLHYGYEDWTLIARLNRKGAIWCWLPDEMFVVHTGMDIIEHIPEIEAKAKALWEEHYPGESIR